MDVAIGAASNNIELSTVYNKGAVNELLHLDTSEVQSNYVKAENVNHGIPEIKDNLPKQTDLHTTNGVHSIGYGNLAELWTVKYHSFDEGVINVSNAFLSNAKGSLLVMANLFEEESARLKDLTNISQEERASRLQLLEKGFAKASYWHFSTPAHTYHDMNSLTNFAENAAENIDTTKLKYETKNLMFEGLSKAVSSSNHYIQSKARYEAYKRYAEMSKSTNESKKTPSYLPTEEEKQYSIKLFDAYKVAIKKLDWLKINNDITEKVYLYYTTNKNTVEENDGEETVTEVTDTVDLSKEATEEIADTQVSNGEANLSDVSID